MRIDGLTAQQFRVAELIAAEKTDKDIGRALHIAPESVRFHIRRIASAWNLTGNVRVAIANRLRRSAA